MEGKLKFLYNDYNSGLEIQHNHDLEHESWPTLVEHFFYFLRGCSFPLNHKEWVEHFADVLKDWEEAESDYSPTNRRPSAGDGC